MAPKVSGHALIGAHEALLCIESLLPTSNANSSTSTNFKTPSISPNLHYSLTQTHAYLTSPSHPLHASHTPQSPARPLSEDTPIELMRRVSAAFEGKGKGKNLFETEYLQLLDLRPRTGIELEVCVEALEERFSEEEQVILLGIVREVLGGYPDDGGDGMDVQGINRNGAEPVENENGR